MGSAFIEDTTQRNFTLTQPGSIEEKVNYCGEYVMYRLSTAQQKEAFIVTLTSQQIKQSEEPVLPVTVSESGLFKVTYRIFDEAVTSSYFCQSIPPIEPKTVKIGWEMQEQF